MSYPRSPEDKVDGIVYFGRMVEKIRLMATQDLHPDLHKNMGKGFDERCVKFLQVDYDELAAQVKNGLSNEEALAWCFENGHHPSDEEIMVWNEFLRKCGWRDSLSDILLKRKLEGGFQKRDDIQTMFEYIDADEGRI